MGAVAIVPAAGKGERFGGAKLLADIKGQPMLDWTLWSLLDGGVERVIVVTAAGVDLSDSRLISDQRVRLVENLNPARGMFSSIQTGLAVAEGDPVLVLPGDMPFVLSSTVTAVIVACIRRQQVIVPVHDERRGHPVAFPASLGDAVLRAPVESTLKQALTAAGATRVELPVRDAGVLRDVDAPKDLDS